MLIFRKRRNFWHVQETTPNNTAREIPGICCVNSPVAGPCCLSLRFLLTVTSNEDIKGCVCFLRVSRNDSSTNRYIINPFTAQACKMSGLKNARRCLQTVYFSGSIINVLSVLCVLMPTILRVMRKRKENCFRI